LPQTCSRCYCWANVASTDGVRTPGHLNFSPFGEAYVDDEIDEKERIQNEARKALESLKNGPGPRPNPTPATPYDTGSQGPSLSPPTPAQSAPPEVLPRPHEVSNGVPFRLTSGEIEQLVATRKAQLAELEQLKQHLGPLVAQAEAFKQANTKPEGKLDRKPYGSGYLQVITLPDGTKQLWQIESHPISASPDAKRQLGELKDAGANVGPHSGGDWFYRPARLIGTFGPNSNVWEDHKVFNSDGGSLAKDIYDVLDFVPLLSTAKSLDNAIRLWDTDPAAANKALFEASISFVGDVMMFAPVLGKLAEYGANAKWWPKKPPVGALPAKPSAGIHIVGENCFVAGTPLVTPFGETFIDHFKVGDLILSRNQHDLEGVIEAKVVEEVFIRVGLVRSVQVNGRIIRTTAEHPIYVYGQGWKCVSELKQGDRLVSHNGRLVTVESISDAAEVQTVYNLRVADYHTYFVGSREWGFSVWAHNAEYMAFRDKDGIFHLIRDDGKAILGADGKPITVQGRTAVELAQNIEKANLSTVKTGTYKEMTKALNGTGQQANHLNQNAVYRGIIPEEEGVANAMAGNAFRDVGTQHYQYHASLESFWDKYRKGGSLYGKSPTNAEYGQAVKKALEDAGYSAAQAESLAAEAAAQRATYGLKESAAVPRIPGKINQTK